MPWFAGNDVIFLDPHTTQSIGVVNGKEHQHEWKMDSSYHCSQASRLHIMQMDPSVAVVSRLQQIQITKIQTLDGETKQTVSVTDTNFLLI
jgi:hypothetical protein